MSTTTPPHARGLFETFAHSRRGVEIEWRELGWPRGELAGWLRGVDVGLIWAPRRSPGLSALPIRSEPRVVVCAAHHRLSGQRTLRVADVLGETFVGCDPLACERWIGFWRLDEYRGGPPQSVSGNAGTLGEVMAIVASGSAITTLPAVVASGFEHLGIASVPLEDARPAVLELIWPESTDNPLAGALIAAAGELRRDGDLLAGRFSGRRAAEQRSPLGGCAPVATPEASLALTETMYGVSPHEFGAPGCWPQWLEAFDAARIGAGQS